jgi:hypothetical protein
MVSVSPSHRLDLVVGDIRAGDAQASLQFVYFGAHLDAQLGVEVGQRFVEQEQLRTADDGAAHGDALALAAGQLARLARKPRVETMQDGGLFDLAGDFVARPRPH